MTFLTRMSLNPARRRARELLASPQAMHAAVLAGFPPDLEDSATDEAHRVLWRIDTHASSRTLLYVCSPARPDLTHLVEQAGWPTLSGWETRDYSPLLGRLAQHQRWAFRLTANPVRRIRSEPQQRGTVRAHVTAAQQTDWLRQRAQTSGFQLEHAHGEPSVLVRDRRTLRFARRGTTVTLASATFEGLLVVTDADALRVTLTAGLGRGKSYGCGLMTLAPAQSR